MLFPEPAAPTLCRSFLAGGMPNEHSRDSRRHFLHEVPVTPSEVSTMHRVFFVRQESQAL